MYLFWRRDDVFGIVTGLWSARPGVQFTPGTKRFSSPPKCRPVLEPTQPGSTLKVFFCEVKQPEREADPLAFSE